MSDVKSFNDNNKYVDSVDGAFDRVLSFARG